MYYFTFYIYLPHVSQLHNLWLNLTDEHDHWINMSAGVFPINLVQEMKTMDFWDITAYPVQIKSNQSLLVTGAEYNRCTVLQWNAYLQALTNSAKKVLGEQKVSKEIKSNVKRQW